MTSGIYLQVSMVMAEETGSKSPDICLQPVDDDRRTKALDDSAVFGEQMIHIHMTYMWHIYL